MIAAYAVDSKIAGSDRSGEVISANTTTTPEVDPAPAALVATTDSSGFSAFPY